MEILGNGIYAFGEAARLTGVPVQRLRAWFLPGKRVKPLTEPDYTPISGRYAISFLDMIDAMVANGFRNEGVSFQKLRLVYHNLSRRFGTKHAFCRKDIATDGQTVFLRAVKETQDRQLIDMFNNQRVMLILEPILTNVQFDEITKLALRWHVTPEIVLDPARNFGKPVLLDSGVSTDVIADAFASEAGDAQRVADWYGIDTDDVLAAVRFQSGLRSPARAA